MKSKPLATQFAALTALMWAVAFSASAQRSSNEISDSDLPLISTVDGYWAAAQQNSTKDQVHNVRLEFSVLFYDPEWQVLYIAENASSNFIPTKRTPLDFGSGDRVRISGTIIPGYGLEAERLTIETLASNAYPEAIPVPDQISAAPLEHQAYSKLIGYVDRIENTDATHTALEIIANNRRIDAYLKHLPSDPIPDLTGHFIQIEGVLDETPSGIPNKPGQLSIWTDGLEKLAIDPQQNDHSPLVRASIDQLGDLPPDSYALVSGLVYQQEPGKSLTIRDDNGQIIIETEQQSVVEAGSYVIVSGYPIQRNFAWTLDQAIYRTPNNPAANLSEHILYRYLLVDQILALPTGELGKGHTTTLTGVVTLIEQDRKAFYLQDSTAGIRVTTDEVTDERLALGEMVTVTGTIQRGNYSPVVKAKGANVLGKGRLPTATLAPHDLITSGSLDSQWIKVLGHIEKIDYSDTSVGLTISTNHGFIKTGLLGKPSPIEIELGTNVEVQGVLVAEADANRRLRSVKVIAPNHSFIQVSKYTTQTPTNLPETSIASLYEFQDTRAISEYKRVTGTVTYQKGKVLYLSEANDFLRVVVDTPTNVEPGDRAEVIGLLQKSPGQVSLRDANIKKLGTGENIEPIIVSSESNITLSDLHDGQLIQFEARLVDTAVSGGELRLFLDFRGDIIEAAGQFDHLSSLLGDLQRNDILSVTGIHSIDFDHENKPEAISVLLRNQRDIDLVQKAPWWTPNKVLAALVGSIFLILVAFTWTVLLRKRIARQTELIHQKVEREVLLETQNREIVSSSRDFIYTIDFQGRFLTFNEAGERITGYTQEESKSITIYDLLDKRVQRRVRAVLERAHKIQKAVFEVQILRKDGSLFWIEASVGFLRREGEAVAAFGIWHDIEASKQIQVELTRAKEAAEENTRTKSSFLATISHEIRTPLNGIIGMSDLLLGQSISSTVREFAESIHQSSNDLLYLINDILDLSKAEAGKLTLNPQPFDLLTIIRRTITLLEPSASTKNIELRTDFPPGAPIVKGDSGRLRQVILNLVGNALKFTSDGYVLFKFAIKTEDSKHVTYRFEVKDTGIGIPRKTQEKLFEAFVQAEDSNSRRFGGTGLGLKISREIVELMGGEIGFQSQPDQGSLFWFIIRFEKTDPANIPPIKRTAFPPNLRWKGPPLKILVAEDFPINQQLIRIQLSNIGVPPVVVDNGKEVMEALAKDNFDLIFMDCQMPYLDGFEATHQIRQSPQYQHIHIVALTANAMQGDRERCLSAGMDDYISKPTRPEDLLAALNAFSQKVHK